MIIALGSTRAAKVDAVRAAITRIGAIDATWQAAQVVACDVTTDAPAMPLTDEELMRGARMRATAAREALRLKKTKADLYVGLEGGFHSLALDAQLHTFLRGWAFVTNEDDARASFGASPSISVPPEIVRRVVDEQTELGLVIDRVAGEQDVRSRQGAWGILSCDLLTRADSFESALIAAFAPFYNARFYS